MSAIFMGANNKGQSRRASMVDLGGEPILPFATVADGFAANCAKRLKKRFTLAPHAVLTGLL
jgi:hypothetical protein